jgi:hypothetical protein
MKQDTFSPVCFYVSQLFFPGTLSFSISNASLFSGMTSRNSPPGRPFPHLNISGNGVFPGYSAVLFKVRQEKK